MRRAQNVLLATKVYDSLEPRTGPAVATSAATLSDTIRREALGVGPFHIADVAPPYGRIYLYSTADTPRPSVLVLALLFHLRDAYPEVLSHVPGALSPSAGFPLSAAAMSDSAAVALSSVASHVIRNCTQANSACRRSGR